MAQNTTVARARHDVGSDLHLGVVLMVVGLLGIVCGVLRSTSTTEMALGVIFTLVGLRLVLTRARDV